MIGYSYISALMVREVIKCEENKGRKRGKKWQWDKIQAAESLKVEVILFKKINVALDSMSLQKLCNLKISP